jgi:hypothetical protein
VKKAQVTIGETYAVKVGNRICPVKVTGVHSFGGWRAHNVKTGREVRIRSAQRLRWVWGCVADKAAYYSRQAASEARSAQREQQAEARALQSHGIDGNRITQWAQDLAAKAATWSPEEREKRSAALTLTLEEFVRFQTLKSQAVLEGVLTPAEGQTIYAALGDAGPGHFERQPYGIKAVLLMVLESLLKRQIAKVGR